jgi:hypothetical protein
MIHAAGQPRSHLFIVRVWHEELDPTEQEWRGKVQHVQSGEARYFRSWQQLIDHLIVILSSEVNPVGEIKPLEPFGIAVLAFRDPDNIQLELAAPLAS